MSLKSQTVKSEQGKISTIVNTHNGLAKPRTYDGIGRVFGKAAAQT